MKKTPIVDALLIKGYIAKWQSVLNLMDWDIRYRPDKPDKGHAATCMFADVDKAATIRVRPDAKPWVLEALVVHELLHIVKRPAYLQATRLLVHVRDDQSRTHLTEMYTDADEAEIETLARALLPGTQRVATFDRKWSKRAWGVFEVA